MSTASIGINPGLATLPYAATTKRTKVVTLANSDINVTTATNFTYTGLRGGYMVAYADSSGKWRLSFNLVIYGTSTGTRENVYFDIVGSYPVVFKAATSYNQALSAYGEGATGIIGAQALQNAGTIHLYHAASSETSYAVSGDVALNTEPTWAAANMEGVLPVDVYIPAASAGIAGLVDNTSGNTAGTPIKGKTNGVAVASGYIGQSSITAGGSITALSGSSIVTLDTVELPTDGGVFLVEGLFSNVKVTANGGFIYANISRDSGGYSILREERFTNDSADLITSGLCSFTTVVNIASGLTAAQRTVAARMQATSTVTGEAQGRIQYIRIA